MDRIVMKWQIFSSKLSFRDSFLQIFDPNISSRVSKQTMSKNIILKSSKIQKKNLKAFPYIEIAQNPKPHRHFLHFNSLQFDVIKIRKK